MTTVSIRSIDPAGFLRFLLFIVSPFILSVAQSVSAFEEYPYDLKLAEVLQKIEMYDYALLQIERMLQQYPDRSERLVLEKSRILYASGKRQDADALLKTIKPGSTHYPEAQLLAGEMAYRRNNIEEAVRAYQEFFKAVKPEAVRGEDKVDKYRRAIRIYARILEQQGKGQEAGKVMELLSRLQGDAGASERQTSFLKVQSLLAAEEGKYAERQAVDVKAVNNAIATLKDLQWIMDGVAAASYVETARAHVILDENEKAIEALKLAEEFMVQIEQTLSKQGNLAASPLAGAVFYYAKALKGLARQAFQNRDEAKAREHLIAAIKRFYKVTRDYPDSQYRDEAMLEFGKCENLLEQQFGASVGLSVDNAGAEVRLKMQQAAAFFNASNYQAAVPIYLEGFRIARRSRQAVEVGDRLITCYAQLDDFLQARAVASYLKEFFPTAESTGDALLRLGAFMYQKAARMQGTEREDLLGGALAVWEDFLAVSLTHPKAADIAFAIAEEQYKVATEQAATADKTSASAQKERLKEQARDAFLQAVPKYQRLVEHFIAYPKGIRALYKLGWIYYSTEQPVEAAESFLRYSQTETDPERNDDRLQAKFRAAEQLMLHDTPAEAVLHFNELLTWLQPDNKMNFDVSTAAAKRLAEDAASYLAWATDLIAEAYRPTIRAFRDEIKQAEQEIAAANTVLQLSERRQMQAEKMLAEAKLEFAELEKAAGGSEDKLQQLAQITAEKLAEDTATMSAEERLMAERNQAARAERLTREMIQQERSRLQGEQLFYENRLQEIQRERATATDKYKKLQRDYEILKTQVDADNKRKQELKTEFDQLVAVFEGADKAVKDTEEDMQKLRTALEKAREYETSDDPEQQKKGTVARQRVAVMIQDTTRKLNEVHRERERASTPQTEERRHNLQQEFERLQAELMAKEEDLRQAGQAQTLAAKDAELQEARLVAVAKTLDRNRSERQIFQLAEKAGDKERQELRRLTEEYLEAFRAVMERSIEKAVLTQTIAQEEMALARQLIEQKKQKIAELKDEMAPVLTAFEELKQKAEERFTAFLQKYAKSKHAPENMARMGSIYLEFNNFSKAEQTLSQLAQLYPNSDAGKQALFNLGRAQAETDKYEQAAETFSKLLQTPEDVATGNLVYISDIMLRNQQPAVALMAGRNLLQRSEDRSRDDYRELRERIREHALFRAAEASFALENFEQALDFYQALINENEKTGYFFDAKFGMGLSRRRLNPPQLEAAKTDFAEILQYADDPVLTNKALCFLGETMALQGGQKNLAQAAARFQQVVLLANPEIPENQPWIEKAFLESAKCFARLGKIRERDETVANYRDLYPDGIYREEINNLPAAEFTTTHTASQVQP